MPRPDDNSPESGPSSESASFPFRIRGIGADIIRISLVQRILTMKPQHLPRLFHPDETAYCEQQGHLKYASFAARFAAKEAFLKALGHRIPWNEVWVRSIDGRPYLQLSDRVRSRFPGILPLLSLTHDGDYALAFVILILERSETR